MVLETTISHPTLRGRRTALAADIKHTLQGLPKGAPSYRRDRSYLFHALVGDLTRLGCLVPRLVDLKPLIIERLIQFWRSEGNSPATILKKIAVLRSVTLASSHICNFPSNAALGLVTPGRKKLWFDSTITLNNITKHTIEPYCTLQYLFGLKHLETLHFSQDMIIDKGLYLRRHMTYNRRDRWVSIDEDVQKIFISKILQEGLFNKRLTTTEFKHYQNIFQYELRQSGITDNDHFRYQFIYRRYTTLQQQGLTRLAALKRLRQELGYRTNEPIHKVLSSCQSNS